MYAQELAYPNPIVVPSNDQYFGSLRGGLNSPLPVVGKLHVQFEEPFVETVGEARVAFQPELRELLMEDVDQDVVLFATEVDGADKLGGDEEGSLNGGMDDGDTLGGDEEGSVNGGMDDCDTLGGDEEGSVNGGLDDGDTLGGDEEGSVKGELDEGELFDEPKLEDADELVEVAGCNSLHICHSVCLFMQVNGASKAVPEQSGPAGTHEV